MSDFGAIEGHVVPQFVTSWGSNSAGLNVARRNGIGNPGTITWVANLAVFIPFILPWPYPVRRVVWSNGSTVTTTNCDFGFYSADGTRIFSTGSTTQAGASAPQYVDVTDFVLSPGTYYMAFNCDNTTNRARGSTAATTVILREAGVLQQAVGAVALPATMASAVAATQALYPLIGFTRTTSGF